MKNSLFLFCFCSRNGKKMNCFLSISILPFTSVGFLSCICLLIKWTYQNWSVYVLRNFIFALVWIYTKCIGFSILVKFVSIVSLALVDLSYSMHDGLLIEFCRICIAYVWYANMFATDGLYYSWPWILQTQSNQSTCIFIRYNSGFGLKQWL